MEKKIKTSKEKSSSNINEEKTIIITIVIALIIMGALVVQLVFLSPTNAEKSSAIYYLDSNKQTDNLPTTVNLEENITLWVGVENQNDETLDYQVQIKRDDGTGPLNQSSADHFQIHEKTLDDEDIWEFEVNITIDELGTNRIIFELFVWNETATDPGYEYTGNWVNISVEGI